MTSEIPSRDTSLPAKVDLPEGRSTVEDRTVTGPVREPASRDLNGDRPAPRGWQRWMWIIIAILSGIYVFIPEPTDAVPILGWMDEGVAVLILTYALERLGIRIPLIDRLLHHKRKNSR